MVNDAEKFAEEDKKQREAIDARNAVRGLTNADPTCSTQPAWTQIDSLSMISPASNESLFFKYLDPS